LRAKGKYHKLDAIKKRQRFNGNLSQSGIEKRASEDFYADNPINRHTVDQPYTMMPFAANY
jgi:hypothetical protein